MSDTSPISRGLEHLDYLAVGVYLLFTLGVAWWFGRRKKNVEDFFLGGRRVHWFAVGVSILATLFSTLSYLGKPGEMVRHGVGFFIGYLSLPLTATVILALWIPFYMRLKLTSAYEYLERRFSYPARLTGATLFILLRLGWMSMVIFAASLALDRVKGDDFAWLPGPDVYWWIGLIGVTAAVYTVIGGLEAIVWTDVLQMVLLLAGVLLPIGYVLTMDGTGPADWWRTAQQHASRHTSPPLFSWDVTVRVTAFTAIVNNFFWIICTHGSDQVVLQRYFSTTSASAARRSYLINVATELTMAVLLALAGLALLAFYLKHPGLLPSDVENATQGADKLFPHFLGHQLPAGCAGLIISAFLCDAIQTLQAGANSITAVGTTDIFARWRNKGAGQRLRTARAMAAAVAILVTLNAYLVLHISVTQRLTIIDMMPKFFNMFVGPLGAMFFVGMFLPRCTTRSLMPAVVVGVGVSFVWSWWKQLFGTDYQPTILLAVAVPCITTFIIAALLGLFEGKSNAGHTQTWLAVVRRQATAASEQPSEAVPQLAAHLAKQA